MSVHASTKALRLESESNDYSSINHDSLSRSVVIHCNAWGWD